MSEPGLSQISPELVEIIRRSSTDERQAVVERACLLAVERTGVSSPLVYRALEKIRRRDYANSTALRSQIDALIQKFDDEAWNIQERVEAGEIPKIEYAHAFMKARAVAAIRFALDNSVKATFDCLYESYYAIDNENDFALIVDNERYS